MSTAQNVEEISVDKLNENQLRSVVRQILDYHKDYEVLFWDFADTNSGEYDSGVVVLRKGTILWLDGLWAEK